MRISIERGATSISHVSGSLRYTILAGRLRVERMLTPVTDLVKQRLWRESPGTATGVATTGSCPRTEIKPAEPVLSSRCEVSGSSDEETAVQKPELHGGSPWTAVKAKYNACGADDGSFSSGRAAAAVIEGRSGSVERAPVTATLPPRRKLLLPGATAVQSRLQTFFGGGLSENGRGCEILLQDTVADVGDHSGEEGTTLFTILEQAEFGLLTLVHHVRDTDRVNGGSTARSALVDQGGARDPRWSPHVRNAHLRNRAPAGTTSGKAD